MRWVRRALALLQEDPDGCRVKGLTLRRLRGVSHCAHPPASIPVPSNPQPLMVGPWEHEGPGTRPCAQPCRRCALTASSRLCSTCTCDQQHSTHRQDCWTIVYNNTLLGASRMLWMGANTAIDAQPLPRSPYQIQACLPSACCRRSSTLCPQVYHTPQLYHIPCIPINSSGTCWRCRAVCRADDQVQRVVVLDACKPAARRDQGKATQHAQHAPCTCCCGLFQPDRSCHALG